jgi:DUF2934 family protein
VRFSARSFFHSEIYLPVEQPTAIIQFFDTRHSSFAAYRKQHVCPNLPRCLLSQNSKMELVSCAEECLMPKTKTVSSAATKKTTKAKARPSQEDIASRAYHIYLERGCTPGDPMQDWLQAERELLGSTKKPSRKSRVVFIAA